MGNVVVKIDDDLHARAKAQAAYKGQTWRDWVEAAIAEVTGRQEAERAEAERRRRSR